MPIYINITTALKSMRARRRNKMRTISRLFTIWYIEQGYILEENVVISYANDKPKEHIYPEVRCTEETLKR